MGPLIWLAAVLLLYAAATATVVTLGLAFRARNNVAIAGVVAALIVAVFIPRVGGLADSLSVGLGAVTAMAGMGAVLFTLIRPRASWQERRSAKELARQSVLHLSLVTLSALFLVPFAWLLVTSLKEEEDMSKFPPVWVPRQQVKTVIDGKPAGLAIIEVGERTVRVAVIEEKENGENVVRVLPPDVLQGSQLAVRRSQVTKVKQFDPVWKNYISAVKFLPPETQYGLVFLGNTLKLCFLTILGTLLSSSLVAYSFARLRWPGRDFLFVVLLGTMMIPSAVTMMPVFLIFRWLGWIDSLRPLWVPAFAGSAFNIFLLRQFFMTIPNDLEEAARIDGCSYFGIYWRIMLPLIKPALAALTIMTLMASWNNFMGPLIYVNTPTRMPLSYALQLFQSAHALEPGMLMAASTMVMLPVLVLFFFTQRYFIQGVTLTGIKG